jgi:tetratricopeptide (TPR) repeat protein
MIKQVFFFIIFLTVTLRAFAQTDAYHQLKIQYDSLRKVENHEGALLVAKQMSIWALQNETDTSLRYAVSLRYLGNCFYSMEKNDLAFYNYKLSIHTLKNQNRDSHPDYASSLNNLGVLYHDKGDYKAVEPYYKQALDIRKKVLGELHSDYAQSLTNLGDLYSDMVDYKAAEQYYKQALDVQKIAISEEHPDYAMSLNILGNLYADMGDFRAAEQYYKEALKINKKVLGEYHPDYAMNLIILADLYANMGDCIPAEQYYKQALEVNKKALGEVHPDYAMNLNNLGNVYSDMGDYKSAEPLYKQALEIYKQALGEEHPDYAMSLNNLGILYADVGDYKAAEPLYMKALEVYKQALGEEHPDYAMSLNNLGVLYQEMGDYKAAESYYKRALVIKKKALGEVHPDYAMSLNNLGMLYSDMGENKAAVLYLKQALDIIKKALGEDHPDYAMNLNNLGIIYHEMGDYNSTESYYKRALVIKKKALGEEHPDFAMSLNNLGILYHEMLDYKAAELYLKRALDIKKKALGEGHPDYVGSLNNLGNLYYEIGAYYTADLYFKQVFMIKTSNLYMNFSWLSDQEKQAYWKQEKDFYEKINNFSVSSVDSVPTSTVLCYNANLISKSLLLETSRELDQAITQSSDEEMKTQFSEMKQLRKLYSKMQSEGSTNKEVMERYKTQADSLDKILVNKLGEYAASKRKFEITWKDVQSNLSSSDAAIEFARYYDYKDSSYNYMALVVRPNYVYPKLVKLGKESNIRLAAQNKNFSSLYDLIWKDIDTLLKGVQTVYYSPAGELNSVSFSAMCFEAGDSVLQDIAQNRGVIITTNKEKSQSCNAVLLDKYTLHQLTTTRYLADGTLNKTKPMNSSLALYGGINYDDLPIKSDSISTEITNEEYAFQLNLSKTNSNKKINKKRGKKRSSSNFGEKLEYLPGTKEEITNIAVLMNNSKWEVLSRSDKGTGEYEFKKDLETKVPGVLHIATHGFAFPDELKKETNLVDLNQTSTYKISEDPMVRCGLLFSGANISWMGNPQKMIEQTGDDGILTAAEVANLDLSKTKLVVLSACETGLGKIEGSEGTFGLKRGFKLAGVEQIIVSLWSVPDKETMELMTLFYSDLTKTLNPIASFAKAQKEMRNKYPTDPEKWAGFVLVR